MSIHGQAASEAMLLSCQMASMVDGAQMKARSLGGDQYADDQTVD
jgi:hypothetical protein